MVIIPLLAFAVAYLFAYAGGASTSMALGFLAVMMLNYLAFLFGKNTPPAILALFAGFNIVLLLATMFSGGQVAIWSVLGIGLFNSIMWSNIFTLAISRLKQYTSMGSSLLVMMIVGGAIIPLVQGLVADISGIGVKFSFCIPMIAYAYLVFYGLRGYHPVDVSP